MDSEKTDRTEPNGRRGNACSDSIDHVGEHRRWWIPETTHDWKVSALGPEQSTRLYRAVGRIGNRYFWWTYTVSKGMGASTGRVADQAAIPKLEIHFRCKFCTERIGRDLLFGATGWEFGLPQPSRSAFRFCSVVFFTLKRKQFPN